MKTILSYSSNRKDPNWLPWPARWRNPLHHLHPLLCLQPPARTLVSTHSSLNRRSWRKRSAWPLIKAKTPYHGRHCLPGVERNRVRSYGKQSWVGLDRYPKTIRSQEIWPQRGKLNSVMLPKRRVQIRAERQNQRQSQKLDKL